MKNKENYLNLLLSYLLKEQAFRKSYPNFVPNQKSLFEASFIVPEIYPDSMHVNIGEGLVLKDPDSLDEIINPLSVGGDFYSNYINITPTHSNG